MGHREGSLLAVLCNHCVKRAPVSLSNGCLYKSTYLFHNKLTGSQSVRLEMKQNKKFMVKLHKSAQDSLR